MQLDCVVRNTERLAAIESQYFAKRAKKGSKHTLKRASLNASGSILRASNPNCSASTSRLSVIVTAGKKKASVSNKKNEVTVERTDWARYGSSLRISHI